MILAAYDLDDWG